MAFPQVEDVSDFHFITTREQIRQSLDKGARLCDIAEHCGLMPEARYVFVKAYERYTTNLPLEEPFYDDRSMKSLFAE
tara:strand:+ start:353 stop:586 length:234 start_codon:yes stop_codon:yes gene_type:complete